MTAETQEEIKTTEKREFDFIKGEFTPEDAIEIITHMISKKIGFHETRSFNRLLRVGSKDEASLKRAEELKSINESIKEFIRQAEVDNKLLRIESKISIEFI